jgi:SAM-dependent methyltransferase
MSLLPKGPERRTEVAIWQDVEFGAYAADLQIWDDLARDAGGAVVELGAGSGRVALHLARAGFEVIAVERDSELAEELERRAGELAVVVVAGDVAGTDSFSPEAASAEIRLAIAPLQMIQLLDEEERRRTLAALAGALAPGGRCALALVDESTLLEQGVTAAVRPDMREVDGWVYYSEPLWVQVFDETLRMRRLRERVSPTGDQLRRVHDDVLYRLPPERLESEARVAGLHPVERRSVSAGDHEAGSVVVVLEVR